MLNTFLKNLRKQRCIGASQALTQVGQGWSSDNGALQKEFNFVNFKEASHFIQSYTNFCQKTGTAPQWSNVYNRVNVTIANEEFGEISTKDVEVAQYLDMVHSIKVSNHLYINDHHSMEKIMEAGNIGIESNVNHRGVKTTLFLEGVSGHARLA